MSYETKDIDAEDEDDAIEKVYDILHEAFTSAIDVKPLIAILV